MQLGICLRNYLSQVLKRWAWFLLTAYRKIKEERNDFKMELLIKKEAELQDLKNPLPIHTVKNEKIPLRSVAQEPFGR